VLAAELCLRILRVRFFVADFLGTVFLLSLPAVLMDPFFGSVLHSFFLALESANFFLVCSCASASAFFTGVSVRIDDFPRFRPPGFWTLGSATGNGRIISGVM
jgi:hypothetical protein